MQVVRGEGATGSDLVDRGARLFEFLARVQQIGMTSIADVADLGSVIWLAELPDHPMVRVELRSAGLPFLMVGKVRVRPVVPVPQEVRLWLVPGRVDDPDTEPTLRKSRPGNEGVENLSDHPEIVEEFDEWLPDWRGWAVQARRDLRVQRLYRDVYDCYTQLTAASETTEAVLGLGCLSWRLPEPRTVRRHVLTAPVKIEFDTDSGDLSVVLDDGAAGLTVELMDFLDNARIGAPSLLHEATDSARSDGVDPFDRPVVGSLVRRLINCVDPTATYTDDMIAVAPSAEPNAAYAPALIVRARGKRGLVRVLNSIATRIRAQGELPDGIRNLIDPDSVPVRAATPDDGAIVRDGADCFLPLQLNDVQLRILEHVDRSAHTIVQGPPGTGKTHTAAALITHLLAQGKRVLVTAQTDRALEEVRGKLREEIKPLCVAVVGTSRDAFTDLEVAVERISEAAAEHDPAYSAKVTRSAQQRITELIARRTTLKQQLVEMRESEVMNHSIFGYTGTLTDIVLRHLDESEKYGWIGEFAQPDRNRPLPVPAEEIIRWRELLLDPALRDPEVLAPDVVTAAELPHPDELARWFVRRTEATERCRSYSHVGHSEWVHRIAALAPAKRAELGELVHSLERIGTELSADRETWVAAAISAVRSGRAAEWQERAVRTAGLLPPIERSAEALGITEVQVQGENWARLVSMAESLDTHIRTKGAIDVRPDGLPKTGLMTPKVVKASKELFERVSVDGRVPTSADQLAKFLHFERAVRQLNQLDAVWYGVLEVTAGAPPATRLAWHRDRQARLHSVMNFGTQVSQTGQRLRQYGVAEPDWSDGSSVRTLFDAFDAVEAMEELRASEGPIDGLEAQLRILRAEPHATQNVSSLHDAVENADISAYRSAFARLSQLHEQRRDHGLRHELGARMSKLPRLRDEVSAAPEDPVWDRRLGDLPEAWAWAGVRGWLAERTDRQVNELFIELDRIEAGLRDVATELAVTRAWDRAVSPGRLSQTSRSDLRLYAQLVRKQGKGTGRYAARREADIKQTLARCRSAVPVWIMPIYRVVEQLDIEQDMFDVVVVDEASQAGLEAVFLQYLAPRIVVIGDDKQVSPSGVGIDQRELRGLATQYLSGDRFLASWSEPKRSLFDEATMRFSARLTLVEHRRCVPEIIGFSNMIAYEPQNVRLIPVRLYGSDRLPPIRTVHVADGVSTKSNTNEAEAEAIVDRIAACIDDPAYDGKTFGVISLLGVAQAKLIWDRILLRFQPEELARRELRCGDAADFQGAERDVIFLSMVKAAGSDTRLVAQTSEQYEQRYNVAVSRARDQLWLFHSVTLEQLRNSSDMRYRLLDYCLDQQRPHPGDLTERPERCPDDRLATPFESLFQQRVFNAIVDRGYQVSAHYEVTGYVIDMVVIGGHARVAIECEGARWDGPEQFHRDLARQRDLERCDWPFFRIRQSQFAADPEKCLEPLWELFEELGLQPIGTDVGAVVEDSGPETETDLDAAAAPRTTESEWPQQAAEKEVSATSAEFRPGTSQSVDASAGRTEDALPTATVWTIEPYSAFTELLAPPVDAGLDHVAEDLLRVVQVEGPVSGARIRAMYLRGTDGAARAATVDRVAAALRHAVDAERLLDEDPLELGDENRLTYRVPGQQLSRPRTLGARQIDQVPARELAEIMAHRAAELGWRDRAALMRGVLRDLGQRQLDDQAIAELALVLPLARTLADE
ncbi:AAA domain-containing protein [Nocardia macrotermitis]|uniref:AAA domain-containing protein n=1 Tax=Nocardia macrotermitis TaxID=2585198 RepID=A0A7K0CX64_9NOCA|nr:AAA domain-containing protein [Nocardia macrotermitis]MQY18086.1 hypothetical protein [Nocardia macrotermitis]